MTTNQTIDGVQRALLQSLYTDTVQQWGVGGNAAGQLRALLDADKVNNRQMGLVQFVEAHQIKPAAQPQGVPVLFVAQDALDDPQCVGMHATRKPNALQRVALYTEQPAPVALASLEIVGRQCFPSEAMKAVQGYRKEPWVDGEVDQLPSEPGFYRVEPLVRLSDVTAPVAVAKQLERLKTRAWAVMQGALDGASVHPCDEHSEEVKVRTLAQAYQDLYASLTASPK